MWSILEIIFVKIKFLKCKTSKNKNILHQGVRCSKTILHGHNVLFKRAQLYGCDVGEYSYIQSDCRLQSTKIGKYCSIADNVRTGFGSHPTNMVSTFPSFYYNTVHELGYSFYGGSPKVELLKKVRGRLSENPNLG